MSAERGVLYMASGDPYIEEARQSAASVNRHMPDVPVAIATDEPGLSGPFDMVLEHEFETRTIGDRSWLIDSTIPAKLSPFDRTLYLDTDTLVLDDVSCLFDLLGEYDLAISRPIGQAPTEGLPEPCRQFNCGVIAYADTAATRDLLADWRERYLDYIETETDPVDQPAFAHALYNSSLRWFCLPPEYNVRVPQRGALTTKARIVHGRHPAGLGRASAELNQYSGPRTYRERTALGNSAFVVRNRGTLRYHTENVLSKYGARTLLAIVVAFVLDRLDGGDRMAAYSGMDLG